MKINWKIRIRNKAWLAAVAAAIVSFCYQVMEVAGYTPTLPQEVLLDLIAAALTILAMIGIVIDPTTTGVNDSDLAMTYGEEEDQNGGEGGKSKE